MKRPHGLADDDLHLVKRFKRDETQYMFSPSYIDDAIIEKMVACVDENAADKVVINLDNSYDNQLDDEMLCIARSLQLFQGVESLSVRCSILSETKSQAIAGLINCSGITKFSVKYNSGAFGTLLESISPVKALSSLKLKSPQSSVADMLSLCMFLRRDNLLGLNIVGVALTQETMRLLSSTLSYSTKLCSFQYSAAGLSYENLKTIGNTISINSSIILSSATIEDGSDQIVSRRRLFMKKLASEWTKSLDFYSLNMMQKFYVNQVALCYVMRDIKHNSIIIKCSANDVSPRRLNAVLIKTFNPKLAETFWPDFSKKWISNFYNILGVSKSISGGFSIIPKEILDYIASMILPTEVIVHYDHKADR